jgi:hypothetical protein
MATREFVKACKEERDALLALYVGRSSASAVSAHLDAAGLSPAQRAEVVAALDTALTDAFYTMLMGIAGAGSLGGSQQEYRLADEQSDRSRQQGMVIWKLWPSSYFTRAADTARL